MTGERVRYLFLPEQKTLYAEIGIDRNSFTTSLETSLGDAKVNAHSYDLRLGGGYLVLTEGNKLLFSPYGAFDDPNSLFDGCSWG